MCGGGQPDGSRQLPGASEPATSAAPSHRAPQLCVWQLSGSCWGCRDCCLRPTGRAGPAVPRRSYVPPAAVWGGGRGTSTPVKPTKARTPPSVPVPATLSGERHLDPYMCARRAASCVSVLFLYDTRALLLCKAHGVPDAPQHRPDPADVGPIVYSIRSIPFQVRLRPAARSRDGRAGKASPCPLPAYGEGIAPGRSVASLCTWLHAPLDNFLSSL